MFNEKDLAQLTEKGISLELVNKQIADFKRGYDFMNLSSPAIPGDGLLVLSKTDEQDLVSYFEQEMKSKSALKFVPASGAASRMFKSLFEFLEKIQKGINPDQLFEDKSFNSPHRFFDSIRNFAFFPELKRIISQNGLDLEALLEEKKYDLVLDYFLGVKGLNYGNLPKGLLLFHNYPEGARLALEEHFLEGIHYACSSDGIVKMHFTVSAEHQDLFAVEFERLSKKYQESTGLKFSVESSLQKPSTDTIAVDMNNNPFRNSDDSLLFRPAGHGALIENLNDLDEDIIFIKNIDNIVPDHLREDTIFYKKMIGGLLLKTQTQLFDYLEDLDAAQLNDEDLEEMKAFLEKNLMQSVDKQWNDYNRMEKIDYLYNQFNRPIRVCGMVKNEGEPGGGPFKVLKNGEVSLQIVEGSQIDMHNPVQVDILKKSTHFNPVDLVCGVRNFAGQKFDLTEFVDPDTGFISIKSKDGRDLKAQELPGLWNGAMANWITIFVEVPISTFNPVKTINDLLRPQHQ